MISTHELSEKVGQAQRFTRVEIFLQQMVNGLVIASVLVLVALGITLIFGLTGIVFFAQGELLMLGGFTVWFTVDQGGNYFLGIVLAASLLLALGFFLERGLMRFTLESPLNGFIVSLGLIIALQHIVILAWGALDKGIARPISALWNVGDVHISATRVFVVGVAAVVVVLYFFVISRTRYGRALRSVAEDREIAAMMGIPVRRYITAVFVVGSATAGLGGALLLALFPVNPFIGANFVIKWFCGSIDRRARERNRRGHRCASPWSSRSDERRLFTCSPMDRRVCIRPHDLSLALTAARNITRRGGSSC